MPIIKDIDKNFNLTDMLRRQGAVKDATTLVEKRPEETQPEERPVDRSLIDNGYWERATFTVPEDVPDERVQAVAQKYRIRAGKALEVQGFTILDMLDPQVTDRLPESGRKRYDILAFVRRTPIEIHIDVPDFAVPELEKKGLKLKE